MHVFALSQLYLVPDSLRTGFRRRLPSYLDLATLGLIRLFTSTIDNPLVLPAYGLHALPFFQVIRKPAAESGGKVLSALSASAVKVLSWARVMARRRRADPGSSRCPAPRRELSPALRARAHPSRPQPKLLATHERPFA